MTQITKPINLDETQKRIATAMETVATQQSNIATMLQNDYATKAYVSNQVQEYAGTFRGTFNTVAELNATVGNHHNDYAFVKVTDTDGDNDYDRYKYNGSAWLFEYRLNNTHFTSAELAAIRSGMTTAKRDKLDKLTTNLAYLGLGYGTCSTAAATAAKTVTISNFLLLPGGIVSVLFTTANTAAGATLNVSSTGAKPICANGTAVQPGLIKANTVVQMQYDGTAWNIVGMFGLEQSASPSDLYVDMGLPSGVLWAKANIDITTQSGFQEVNGEVSPFKYECSFVSWGNTDMHNNTSISAFSYDWGSANDGPYAQTPGAALTGNMAPSQDAARANLGAPWRMPTTGEYAELFNNIDFVQADGTTVIDAATTDKRVTVDGIMGIYLKSKINGNLLFFPCSGYGHGQSWSSRGSHGRYWSSSLYSAANGRYLSFYSGGVYPQYNNYRFYGFAVRPVQ